MGRHSCTLQGHYRWRLQTRFFDGRRWFCSWLKSVLGLREQSGVGELLVAGMKPAEELTVVGGNQLAVEMLAAEVAVAEVAVFVGLPDAGRMGYLGRG